MGRGWGGAACQGLRSAVQKRVLTDGARRRPVLRVRSISGRCMNTRRNGKKEGCGYALAQRRGPAVAIVLQWTERCGAAYLP